MARKMRLMRVEWMDAASNDTWRGPEQIPPDGEACIHMETVGYVLRSSRKEVVLAQTKSETGKVSATMAIPRGSIIKMKAVGRQ